MASVIYPVVVVSPTGTPFWVHSEAQILKLRDHAVEIKRKEGHVLKRGRVA